MITNGDGTYIYLVVPAEFECVYTKLLTRVADLGVDIVKDCSATCRGINRQVLNCWNIFQAACASYELGNEAQAAFMIKYIDEQLNLGCSDPGPGPGPDPVPSITNFRLNVTDVIGPQTITINQATFSIQNIEEAQPNSLRIVEIGTGDIIGNNLPLISPVSIVPVTKNIAVGQTISWKAIIVGNDGEEYESNVYSITSRAPEQAVTMFYGNTSVPPQEFQTMPLDGRTPKPIEGNNPETFIIHQTDSLHYLLIPEDEMDLIRAEYGTVLITTLWDNATQQGAYFTTNPGGVHEGVKYRVFFSYSPMGAFPDDIRITCKNK